MAHMTTCIRWRNCRFLVAVLVVLGVWLPVRAEHRTAALHLAWESIRQDEIKQHVEYLADERLEGREAGTRGGQAAGDYLIGQLARLGLRPAGSDGAYSQPFGSNFRNILALMDGNDPERHEELVAVGAHYDHIGYGTGGNSKGPAGYIHPGADDNASGVAGLLELAEAATFFAKPPRRAILFAFWDAEEKGMLGSRHWLAHPTLPRRNVVFYLNLDMIGRLRSNRLVVLGTRSSYGLRLLCSRHNPDAELDLHFTWKMAPEADYFPFFERGIPVLALFTGLHDEYHRPSDRPELVDAAGIRRITRLALGVLDELANADSPPAFREASRQENEAVRKQLAETQPVLPAQPLRVGIVWRRDDAEPHSVEITAVVPQSPAHKAGLKPGDRIVEVEGLAPPGDDALADKLRTLPGPIRLRIERQGRLRTIEIQVSQRVKQAA